MLPFEAHLLAAGWPRYKEAEQGGGEGDGSTSGSEGERVVEREGSRGARMLFQARRWALQGGGGTVPWWMNCIGLGAGVRWGWGWGHDQPEGLAVLAVCCPRGPLF